MDRFVDDGWRLPRIGFTTGDCLTLRAADVLADKLPLRRPLLGADVGFGAESVLRSTGEAVVPVPYGA